MVGVVIGLEEEIHQGRKVGVIAGKAIPIVVPVMEFRCADETTERTDRKTNVGVDEDRPDAAEGDKAGQKLEWKTKQKGRQIDESHRVDGIERVLAMSCEPVKMFGRVMD